MFCPFCGSQLNDGSIFCSSCGSRLDNILNNDPAEEVAAAPGGIPIAGGSGDEMPSIGASQEPSQVSLAKSADSDGAAVSGVTPPPFPGTNPGNAAPSAPDLNDLSGITPPPFPGTNSGNAAASVPDLNDLSGITPPPFPGTNSGNAAPSAPDLNDLSGITPPPFPGTNSGNAAGYPGQNGAPGSVITQIPPEFGQPLPEASAVRPVKRSKLPLVIVLSALGVLIAGGALAFVITLNNGFLYRSGGVRKIYELTHLCVQHHYLDADCENPERCDICGSERGEALGHDWTEATCTAPRTCTVCGKTEGELAPHTWENATCTTARTCTVCGATDGSPLGHTTGLGTCTRCGEKITDLEDTYYSILNAVDDADSYYNIGYEYFDNASYEGTLSAYYSAAIDATYYFVVAKNKFQQAADLCGSYPEFSDLKQSLINIAYALPSDYPDYTTESLSEYINQLIDATYAGQDFARYALEINDRL